MWKHGLPLASIVVLSLLGACRVVQSPPTQPGSATPLGVDAQRPEPKQFHLGTAASALVAQSHEQVRGRNYQAAGVTLERALRIEPANPLLYIELGQVRMQEGNALQANGFGHKALALATGDSRAQAQAWRLIADSLRAQGKDPEASDAERRAGALAPR
jgi:predicted Zn-dependent protease